MSKPEIYKAQRHPSGRGYEVIDHRDMSLHGHWSDESTAAILATTWNLELAIKQRDELLAVLRAVDSSKQLPPNGPTQTLLSETLKRYEENA
jgi:hypothetical protein